MAGVTGDRVAFGPVERYEVGWRYRFDRDALIDLAASRSYVITLAPAERAGLLAQVRTLVDITRRWQAPGEVPPYIAECYRTDLPGMRSTADAETT